MIQYWPTEQEPRRIAFISDLHLFSRRCNAHEHELRIEQAVEWGEMCVWGGDLFDFRWSGDRQGDATIGRALDWLQHWYDRFPGKTFVFLSGNHDAHRPFIEALRSWSERRERFFSDLDCLRVRDTLLVHGDVIEGDGSHEAFTRYRNRWHGKSAAGPIQNQAYDVAIATRVHRAVASAAHRKRHTCLKLLRWMNHQPPESIEGVRRVVFGHTHRLITGMRIDGIRFYNGGAAIRHVPFSPVMLELPRPSNGKVESIE